jgi:hypothetical protein
MVTRRTPGSGGNAQRLGKSGESLGSLGGSIRKRGRYRRLALEGGLSRAGNSNPGAGNLAPSQNPDRDKRHADLRSDLDIYPASLAPPASVLFRFLAADAELSLPKPAEPMILCAPLRQNPVRRWPCGDIGGFPMEPTAPRRRAPSPR